jgi:hypothetical protein
MVGHNGAMWNAIEQLLSALENSSDPIDEYSIEKAIRALGPKEGEAWVSPFEYEAELTAFGFAERRGNSEDDPATFYRPMFRWTDEDGTCYEWPSISGIDSTILEYWKTRTGVRHPVMRARYAGLVWEVTPHVTGKRADHSISQIYIDAVVEMASKGSHRRAPEVWGKLEHALNIAIESNDVTRVERLRDTIIEFERRVDADSKIALWGHGFDLLYRNRKARLTEAQRAALIRDLEERLKRVSDTDSAPSQVDRRAAEAAGRRLAIHYRSISQKEDVRRVLQRVRRAVEYQAQSAPPMVAQRWYQELEQLFREFELNAEASEFRERVRDLGPEAEAGMITITHEVRISNEKMKSYVDAILEGDRDGAIQRFVHHHVPSRERVAAQLDDLAQQAPFRFFVTTRLMDHKGRPIGELAPLRSDPDGHVVAQIRENMRLQGICLRRVIESMVERFSLDAETLMQWLTPSPIFPQAKWPILRRGLDAFLAGDSLVALHLLVPQVEDAIRELAELVGADVYRPNRQGGMDLRAMDDLLRDQRVIDVLSSDGALYFQVLYTDRRGFNLRNSLCHGLMRADEFGQGLADRVFHSIVMFAQVRGAENDSAGPATA